MGPMCFYFVVPVVVVVVDLINVGFTEVVDCTVRIYIFSTQSI